MFTLKVEKLRQKYPLFIYESYLVEQKNYDLVLSFKFSAPPDLAFESVLVFKDVNTDRLKVIDKEVLDNLAFHIGLGEITSYWKATCSPKIVIKPSSLNKEQLSWWHKQIINGMGEYFFENEIDFTGSDFLELKNEYTGETFGCVFDDLLENKVLVPVGGGKDSLVTLSLIKESNYQANSFILNNNRVVKTAFESSLAAGFNKPMVADRFIDKKLTSLAKESYLNGHVPFSLYLAFVTTLGAVVGNYKYIAVSNESSANEESLVYLGRKINHQYSKSYDFEVAFNNYAKKYLAKNVEYFSFLRPLLEIQIVKLFSKKPQFYKVFSSCNVSLVQNKTGWCGKCSKCIFVFIMIYSFISKDQAISIFGSNLFEDSSFIQELRFLTGLEGQKPFECVGTKEEVKAGLYLSLEKNKKLNIPQPVLLDYFEKEILPCESNIKNRTENLLKSWNNKNLLLPDFEDILKKEVKSV